jgi:hypothetical protein
LLAEQSEQRDAETLEIGEKMIAEQEQLLAGKYKTTEDLESAYKELEKKLGEQGTEENSQEEVEQSTEQESEEVEYNPYNEDGSVNYEAANEVYGNQLSKTFQDAEIDPFAMNEYFSNNNGTLSEDMYTQLETAGLPKDLVDSYLEGVRAQAGYEETLSKEAEVLIDSDIAELKAVAGGEEAYANLMEWATENLEPGEAKSFDEVIETGNKSAVKFAIKALMGQYEDTVGRDSDLLQGKKSSQGESYRSMAEVVRDMNNPLYETDESYRDDVRRKLERSNLKL